MKSDAFKQVEYEQVVEEDAATIQIPKVRYQAPAVGSSCGLLGRTVFAIILLISFILIATKYVQQPRACPHHTRQDCFSDFIYDRFPTILKDMFVLALAFSVLFFISLMKCVDRRFFYIVLIYFVGLILVFHQPPGEYNFAFIPSYLLANLTLLTLTAFFALYGLVILIVHSVRKGYFFGLLITIMVLTALCLHQFLQLLKPNDLWTEGILGKKLRDQTADGQAYCKLKFPAIDWMNVLDGKIDLTYHFYDCTKVEFTDFTNNQDILKKYIPEIANGRYIAFPNFRDVPDTFKRVATQNYFIQHATVYSNKADIPEHIEAVLDRDLLIYDIQVKVNNTLVKERDELYTKFKEKLASLPKKRAPIKNIFAIYIDALSRMTFRRKMPKLVQWYENFQKKQSDHQIYQGLRAHALASFTYHNILAFLYGAVSDRAINRHTPFTLTEGATDVIEESEVDPKTGKTIIKKKNGGRGHYTSFIDRAKESGFITGQTSTECATSPLTQEGIKSLPFISPMLYDHSGLSHACDPNYFLPYYQASQGNGPFAAMRRCLYGTEIIDYSIEYTKSFFTKYGNHAKLFQFEMLEAHERSQEVIRYADEKLAGLLEWLDANGHFKDMMFLFHSDHGYHMTPLIPVRSYVYDEDNGFALQLVVVSKQVLTTEDQENLTENEQRVTTMLELFHLMRYLTSPDNSEYHRINSIVSDRIPVDRSSDDLPPLDVLPNMCKRVLNRKT